MITRTVTAAAPSHATPRAKKKRRPAGAGAPAPAPATPKPTKPKSAVAGASGPATAPAPAPAATPAPAPPPVASAPVAPAAPELVKSPEYDPVDFADVTGDVFGSPFGGVTNEFVKPYVKQAVDTLLNPEDLPYFGSTYGAVVPAKLTGVAVGEIGNVVGNVITDALRGVLHGKIPGVEEGKPGLGADPTPMNKLVARLIKGVVTSWADITLTKALAPPPPPPPPIYPPDVKPLPAKPVPAPPPPKMLMGQPIGTVLRDATKDALYTAGISALYDQLVAPFATKVANVLTGRADEEIKPPKPTTPGAIANRFVDNVLGTLLIRSVAYKALPPNVPPVPGTPAAPTPFAGALGISIINNVLGAAWSTVYGRGLGTAIENGVNQLAGIRTKEEVEKSPLPALEHFTRAATRGVAVGATTYVLGNALNATMVNLGASIGGVGGALVAVAGAALIGSVGGTVVDATVGPMLGKLGGQIYSWITGKPAYEQRMEQAAKQPAPGPTPGDPVKAPNGNSGTVPAPDPEKAAPAAPAAPAPAAPAAGAPKKRKKTGVRAVDATSPAINVPTARLANIAAAG